MFVPFFPACLVARDAIGDDFGRARYLYLCPFLCMFDKVLLFLFNILFKDDLEDGRLFGAVFENLFFGNFFTGVNFVLNLSVSMPLSFLLLLALDCGLDFAFFATRTTIA